MPKARTLSDLLAQFESALTYDFQAVHGLRLITAVHERDETELLDLIVWLGPGTAFHAVKSGSKTPHNLSNWGNVEDLLLNVVNLIQHQTYVLRQINNPKKEKVPDVVEGPRGKMPAKRSNDAHNMARAQLAALKRAKNEAQKGG